MVFLVNCSNALCLTFNCSNTLINLLSMCAHQEVVLSISMASSPRALFVCGIPFTCLLTL